MEQCRATLAARIAKGNTKESEATSERHAHTTQEITSAGLKRSGTMQLLAGYVVMGTGNTILGKLTM